MEDLVDVAEQEKLELILSSEKELDQIELSDEDDDTVDEDLSTFGDISIQPKRSVNGIPEGHLPYSCTVLTKELIEYASKALNETEELKKSCIKKVKEFIKKEYKVDVDDFAHLSVSGAVEPAILCSLRTREYDLKRTFQLIKSGVEFASSHQYLFDKNNPDIVQQVINSKVIGFLPYRDSKGRAIVFIRTECWNPDEISVEDLIYGFIVSMHVAIENELNQVAGYVVIADCKNITKEQVRRMGKWIILGIQVMQKRIPVVVQEYHVVHTSPLFRKAWKIAKKFVTERNRKKITFYKSANWRTTLHSKIPPEILPEELGGYLGPYSPDHWTSDLERNVKLYHDRLTTFLSWKKNPKKDKKK